MRVPLHVPVIFCIHVGAQIFDSECSSNKGFTAIMFRVVALGWIFLCVRLSRSIHLHGSLRDASSNQLSLYAEVSVFGFGFTGRYCMRCRMAVVLLLPGSPDIDLNSHGSNRPENFLPRRFAPRAIYYATSDGRQRRCSWLGEHEIPPFIIAVTVIFVN